MVEEARELRRKILGDLTERRRALAAQIEQLQAGKDSLYSAVAHVADAIADVRERLQASDEEARTAAELARRRTDVDHREIEGEKDQAKPPATPGRGEGSSGVATLAEARVPQETAASAGAPVGTTSDPAGGTTEGAEAEAVDELFAKLRAASTETTKAEQKPRQRRDRSAGHADNSAPIAAQPEHAAGAGAEVQPGHADAPRGVEATEDSFASARVAVLRERDAALDQPREELVHELKRALRVEQNELLDRLRSLRRGTNPVEVLSIESSAKNLSEATAPGLAAIYRAGARFASGRLGAQAATITPAELDASAHTAGLAAADRLGGEIASAIARRLEESLRPGVSESGSYQNAVGAVFRDWKGERIEDLGSDHAVAAFSEGVLAVANCSGSGVSWVADDGTLRCSDCDDDELAGVLSVGSAFPTGQTRPPAHGGCRCVIVPAAK